MCPMATDRCAADFPARNNPSLAELVRRDLPYYDIMLLRRQHRQHDPVSRADGWFVCWMDHPL